MLPCVRSVFRRFSSPSRSGRQCPSICWWFCAAEQNYRSSSKGFNHFNAWALNAIISQGAGRTMRPDRPCIELSWPSVSRRSVFTKVNLAVVGTVLPKRVCPGLRIFPTIVAKTAVRQTGGGRLAAARNLIKRKLFLGPLYIPLFVPLYTCKK